MIASPRKLARRGILGINGRNTRYVADGNPRRRMPLVNDKVKTKELAREAGVPVPELYGVIEMQAQIKRLRHMLDEKRSFVIKPACGAQGDGIMVVEGENRKGWRLASGRVLSDRALRHHISNVLSGMYSLNGLQDVAMLEETVRFADIFGGVAEAGVPDLRIIVYRGVPTMAMARIPTRESDGKANLHKGGIGLGIDISTGLTTLGVQYDRVIDDHPESGAPLRGIQMPEWRAILDMSARCHGPTGLDYLGVDIVFDEMRGPLLLELNARPGLAVQLANCDGLDRRLLLIADWVRPEHTQDERVDFALHSFGPP
ncbi:alpha-L-glutamate ligase-like protein [Roseovarius sp. MMSF_3281]|uniref:alpha-L-glutamate ligase-like protein n=1 Tax=Roseovarius sp. MMSF_3281 TaxID=3046694 RepID=UPI00273FE95E|nr:alpha-L-glutamate ligase-like protein [Roseovarius sp. MMSF_3281]